MKKVDPPESKYLALVHNLKTDTEKLIQDDFTLILAEARENVKRFSSYLTRAVIYGGLFLISLIPILASIVIGLGIVLDGQYWLSSLIVGITIALVCGVLAHRTLKKLRSYELDFKTSQNMLRNELRVLLTQIRNLRPAQSPQETRK